MTKELIERLRKAATVQGYPSDDLAEAADAIESLQAENERLENEVLVQRGMARLANGERDALAAKLATLDNKKPWMVSAIDAAKGGQHEDA
jgi:hypothetical protein